MFTHPQIHSSTDTISSCNGGEQGAESIHNYHTVHDEAARRPPPVKD